jgi:hypothetical protein
MSQHEDTDSDTEIDVCIESVAGSGSSEKRMTKEQYHKMMKLADPDYHTIKCRFGGRLKTVELYSTHSNPGYCIRNPVNGMRSKDKVGTNAEKSYFKIRMTSVGDGAEPVTLFYDSPETYERHLKQRLPQEIKREWRKKHLQPFA